MIIFIYGEDSYRSRKKINQLKDKFLKEVDPSGLNLLNLSGENLDLDTFIKTVFASPFLAKKRMVVIENLLSLNKSKTLKEELLKLFTERKDKNSDNILIFYEQNIGRKESKDKLFLWLAKQRYAQEFSFLTNAELSRWLKSEASSRSAFIDSKSAELLISFIGNDLWQLSSELDKLVAYKSNFQEKILADAAKVSITEADIKLLVKGKINEDIFALTNSLAKKDKKTALRLFHEQLSAGLNPLQVLSMLIWQFRILLQAKDLIKNQPNSKLSSRLGVHPYVAQKALLGSKNFELAELKNIYSALLAVDIKIKTGTDPVLSLDLFISQIEV